MSDTPPSSPPPVGPPSTPPAGMPPPAPPNAMTLEIPPTLEPIYSNLAIISHTPSEILMDFARVLPNVKPKVHSRVLMTPLNAKMFLRALADNLARYEAQFGEIVVPTHLAEQLFRPPRPDGQ